MEVAISEWLQCAIEPWPITINKLSPEQKWTLLWPYASQEWRWLIPLQTTVSFSLGNHTVGVVSVRVQSRSTTFVITKGGAKIKHVQPQITKIRSQSNYT